MKSKNNLDILCVGVILTRHSDGLVFTFWNHFVGHDAGLWHVSELKTCIKNQYFKIKIGQTNKEF